MTLQVDLEVSQFDVEVLKQFRLIWRQHSTLLTNFVVSFQQHDTCRAFTVPPAARVPSLRTTGTFIFRKTGSMVDWNGRGPALMLTARGAIAPLRANSSSMNVSK
mmetsp:Transcript_42969/g.101126  ORF Transcript_42969/g.101126 Transcript_42969/m.101126 type:complete len:105 (-) Transcript_42969:354-668(-)